MAGLLRLIVEQFRGDFRGELSWTTWTPTSLLATLIILAGLLTLFSRRPEAAAGRKARQRA